MNGEKNEQKLRESRKSLWGASSVHINSDTLTNVQTKRSKSPGLFLFDVISFLKKDAS